jgi:glycine cleavage system aminomethyltransferase T
MPPVRLSAFHAAHQALGARFWEEGGWRVPEAYGRPEDELARARAGVGCADASASGKLLVRGDGAAALLLRATGVELVPGTAARVQVNGTQALACQLAEDEVLWLVALGDSDAVAAVIGRLAAGGGCVHLADLTAAFAAVDLVGPRALDLLARLSPLPLGALPTLGVAQGGLAQVHAIVIRLGRPPGFRVLVARELGLFVWEALWEAGRDLGLTPVGAAARELLEQ